MGGWLCRQGNYYQCPDWQHIAIAKQLISRFKIPHDRHKVYAAARITF
jgi:hypothetical protein